MANSWDADSRVSLILWKMFFKFWQYASLILRFGPETESSDFTVGDFVLSIQGVVLFVDFCVFFIFCQVIWLLFTQLIKLRLIIFIIS